MKFNNKCVKGMCKVFWVFVLFTIMVSCQQKESAYSILLNQEYPELYEQVFERNADSILTFTSHSDPFIREQAWRSLIQTPVADINDFITKVQYADTEEAWMALSTKELSEDQLNRLHDLWEQRTTFRKGISRVLGQQGNQASLDLLVRNFDSIIDQNHEFESALAISRLMMDYEISENTLHSILKYAAVLNEPDLYRAYFYGFYRGNQMVKDQDILKAIWDGYNWVENPQIKQYILRIAFRSDPAGTLEKLPVSDISSMNVQLAVELAMQVGKMEWNEKIGEIFTQLMEHKNPVVNEVALTNIESNSDKPSDFEDRIKELIIENDEKESSVRLSGIRSLTDASEYLALTDKLAEEDVYLLQKKLDIYRKALETDEYMSLLTGYAESENRMEVLFAAQALSQFWNGLPESEVNTERKEKVRSLVFDFLDQQDRSITYVTIPFMNTSELFGEGDFEKVKEYLSDYELPGDVEVFQVFGQFLKDTFEDEAQELINSLAAEGNIALNNTFKDQGWDIPESGDVSKSFRKPDWNRLVKLGPDPVWVLETGKGIIEIQMDVLSAPATISGMDSLTVSGAYNDVAFHRVVPNFVIQGGDIETGDGFGGPDFVVPTEASSLQYERGRVGIASAGTDTEGSQYFVMHDWAPHLNGRYTIIGEVISGMDVVDKIMVGDKVNKASWRVPEE